MMGFAMSPELAAKYLVDGSLFIVITMIYFRFTKGHGRLLYLLLSIGLVGVANVNPDLSILGLSALLLVFMVIHVINNNRSKKRYVTAEVSFEGGGIKRGLIEPEAAVVLGKSIDLIISMVVIKMIEKGFLEVTALFEFKVVDLLKTREKSFDIEQRSNLRRHAAQQLGKVLYPFEELFLEFFEQNEGFIIGNLKFGILIDPFIRHVAERVGGFDLEATREYYHQIIERSDKESRIDGVLEKEKYKVYKKNLLWILLNPDFQKTLSYYNFTLDWFPEGKDFVLWLEELKQEIRKGISPDEFKLKLGHSINHVDAQMLLADISRATFFG